MDLEQLTDLTPEQQQLLLLLLAEQQNGEPPEADSIQPVPRDGELPLSYAQRRLWFLDQLLPSGAMYNLPVAARLNGVLDVGAMEAALQEVVRRHEVLRTSFRTVAGQPQLTIAPEVSLALSPVDLSDLAGAEKESEAERLVATEAQLPFDLAAGPLVRARLLRLGATEHILIVTLHHIVSDGWSIGVFIQELAILYAAFQSGQPSPLPELAIQYADFAAWQQQWLTGTVFEEKFAYWEQRLAGAPALLELPTNHPRPPVQSYRGRAHTFTLPASLVKSLERLAAQESATLFMVLLAAFKVLLSRYSHQEDIVVGTPIANRNRSEIEPLIGFFVNTLVLRTDLGREPSFRELLARVREVTLEAFDHQDLPFEKLVEHLQPERNLSYQPLFQVLFTLQNAPLPVVELPGLQLEPVEMPDSTAKFDLSLTLLESKAGLAGSWEYNTDLFEPETIERLTGHLRTLLEAAVAGPDQPISSLPLLTEPEKQLFVSWNDTDRDYPHDRLIHQLIEEQAERTPEAIALVSGEKKLSYRELNQRANQLAHHLQALGVGPDALVGIYLKRCPELIISLLAVWKAGGAYVPLDPAYPAERLAFIVQDSGLSVLITDSHLGGDRYADGFRLVRVDTDAEAIEAASPDNPPCSGEKDRRLAYVIYTSGSTGKPKGVMVTQSSLINFLRAMDEHLALAGADRWLAVTTVAFDIAALEIWLPLVRGARIVLAAREDSQDGGRLARLLADSGATILQATPATWRLLLESGWQPEASLKLLCGGEALPTDLAEQLRHSEARLWNLYGPTETTVWSTIHPVQAVDGLVPIGRPLANTKLYVLDAQGQPVPVGVPGELFIGGAGLARGYLNRPELTAEKFVPDPFSTSGGKLYRTGDLVRWRPDGTLEFLGRLDFQVKLRGFRIELGEIEVALRRHPAVRQAAILLREDEPGEKFLTAYIVSAAGTEPDSHALRAFLREWLPEYMLPTAFVPLEALPLTPNGKLDRRALPRPTELRVETASPNLPRNWIEAQLVQIWLAILPIERLGIQDNFFALGGHSLLANRAIFRAREVFGVDLPVRALFEAPTVAALAIRIQRALDEAPSAPRATSVILPVPRSEKMPLSFSQNGLWFLDRLSSQASLYNLPAVTRLRGDLNVQVLESALREVIRRHEILRTVLPAGDDGLPYQRIVEQIDFTLPVTDLSGLPEEQARLLAEKEIQLPFDLEAGPLVRARLLRLGAAEHILIVTLHHIVSDGWSVGVFIQELAALYAAFQSGQPSPLPELAIQYADFAVWQQQPEQQAAARRQLAYWQGQLAGAPELLKLPTDYPRPAVQRHNGATHALLLPAGLTESLKQLAAREGTTLFMVLLAAFKVLLARYSRQEDIVIGTPVANRNRAEIEPLIGYFINALVLRTDLGGGPSFRELLERVRRVTLEAFDHQDLLFEHLVEALQPKRDLSYAPLFQVMFVLQNASVPIRELAGLTVEPVTVFGKAAKFDLTLAMEETAQGLQAAFEYDTDLFDPETIERMAAHLLTLLEAIVAHPDQPISSLPLLTDPEKQLLASWNDTNRDYPLEHCLQHWFEQQVERTPEAVALVFEQQQLSYRELDARANQLAHHLQSLGVGAEVLVGVCLERSVEMVVALLAVLKAGGAYLPLDPGYPAERLTFMLEDARPAVVLAHAPTWALLEELESVAPSLVLLDRDWQAVAIQPEQPPTCPAKADNLAYVIYTSGSTGKPKGAANTHRAICNRLLWMQEAYQLGVEDAVLQKTPFSFDVSVWEFFWPLMTGARLVLAQPGGHRDSRYLCRLIARERITHVHFVPAMLNVLLDEADLSGLTSLKRVIVSGEALPPALQNRFFARLDAELHNLYGPTEAAVDVTCWQCQPDLEAQSVPIGHPIANIRIHLLDAHGQPVPVGVPGELFIGGVGVARGYLNRPELTAEKFVPDPFSPSGEKLYRTGDLARRRPDGAIEYLGRLDFQVKLRGFRIELGEIETVLSSHPEVREAAVQLRDDLPGGAGLVAYIVPLTTEPDSTALRTYLKERLPEYMVPALFVSLNSLPLNANGKLDRRALPAPEKSDTPTEIVAPRTSVEEVLADIWAEVLDRDVVGVEDNFFDLGGHSLVATQVVSQIQTILRLEVPLYALFENPTVAGLARFLLSDPQERPRIEKTAQLLLALSELSDDDAQDLLTEKHASPKNTPSP
ncbi:non-ribosomal peptide synthetase [Gloeobacter kilaueensis]|uniref:Cyclohexanecarboxylate-CoA ligase n=1 Tax=Gloeobacter kilaueensis (strain ATCC BAA-2537 / CCAP 1431/1 / ULC 316 / JS1) TaxID=1183438 RepID=U5QKB0_GLOK1|nr:non-ribosomal peptide synthetase [Gloeobacter kilaueensis]AGY58064.1 cyclohexanecarboxylate-CoA ligase [Gloeobacter kilaueensis JS1]